MRPRPGYDATILLARERPDLLPLVRRLVDEGGEGYVDDVPQADLEELERRGLIELSEGPFREP